KEWLNEFRADAWQVGVKLATEHMDSAQKASDSKQYDAAKSLLTEMKDLEKFITDNAPAQTQPPIPESISKRKSDLAVKVQEEENLAEFIKRAEESLKTPNLVRVAEIETDATRKGYANNTTIKGLLDQAKKSLREQIKFANEPQAASQPLKS